MMLHNPLETQLDHLLGARRSNMIVGGSSDLRVSRAAMVLGDLRNGVIPILTVVSGRRCAGCSKVSRLSIACILLGLGLVYVYVFAASTPMAAAW